MLRETSSREKRFNADGRLDKAAKCFIAELADDPHDASAHYLLANVYLSLQRTGLAIAEYRKGSALDPHGQAGQLSRQALASIAAEGLAGEAATAATSPEHVQERPKEQKPDIDYTRTSASKISRETEERARAAILERDAAVKHILDEGDARCKVLENEMYDQINLYGGTTTLTTTITGQPTKPTRYAQRIRGEYQPQLDAIKAEARRRADETIAFYHDRAAAIEDSAISLDKAYVTPSGNTRLSPLGTNTYVRSYETSDEASGNLVPVQAAPARSLNSPSSKQVQKSGAK